MKLKYNKQSLHDWAVEDEKGVTLAWIQRGKDKIFTITYTKHLDKDLIVDPEYALSFAAATVIARNTIANVKAL